MIRGEWFEFEAFEGAFINGGDSSLKAFLASKEMWKALKMCMSKLEQGKGNVLDKLQTLVMYSIISSTKLMK